MTPQADGPQEDQFAERLAAWDEALARGDSSTYIQPDADNPELRARLEKGLACVQKLQKLRRRGSSLSASGFTNLTWRRPVDIVDPDAAGPTELKLPADFGRFQLRRILGRGGFGTVFLAHDPLLRREVALKMPHAAGLIAPDARERFLQEARAAAGLDHAHLVTVYEAGAVGPIAYITSAYCPGVTLAEWLKEHSEPVPFRDAVEFVAILARAVAHAHARGVIHRDLKPANILLSRRTAPPVSQANEPASPEPPADSRPALGALDPKIADFGLAKVMGESTGVTRSGTVLGTPSYMAPEQAAGQASRLGPAVDTYSLGAILYEVLTSLPPFRGESEIDTVLKVRTEEPISPRNLRPRLPLDLETICLKCLQKDPARRYRSAEALAEDLERFVRGEPIFARPVGRLERTTRWCRRHPMVASLTALLLVTFVSGLAGIVWQWFRAEQHADVAVAERNTAIEERLRAEGNFRQAQEVIRRLTTVGEDLLRDPHMAKRGREILQEALTYYQGLIRQKQINAELRREIAQLAVRVAGLQHTLGQYELAEATFAEAIQLMQPLLEQSPDSFDLRRNAAVCFNRWAHLCRDVKKWDQAEATYGKAVDILQDLHKQGQAKGDVRMHLANVYLNLSLVHATKRKYEQALALCKEALALQDSALMDKPSSTLLVAEKAISLDLIGLYSSSLNRLDAAEANCRAALDLRESLLSLRPTDPEIPLVVGRSCRNLAGVLDKTKGRATEAEELYRRSEQVLEALTKQHPHHPGYQHDLVHSVRLMAERYEASGRLDEAAAAWRRVVAIRSKLANEYPYMMDWRLNLVSGYLKLAGLLKRLGRAEEARAAYLEGLKESEPLLEEHPERGDLRRSLALNLGDFGDVLAKESYLDEAAEARRLSLDLRRKLVADFPEAPEHRRDLATGLAQAAGTDLQAGRVDQAVEAWRESLRLREALVRQSPASAALQLDLARTQSDVGRQMRSAKRFGEAIALLEPAVFAWSDLKPANAQVEFELTNVYQYLGYALRDGKHAARAEGAFREALKRRQALLKRDPKSNSYRTVTSNSHYYLGNVLHYLHGKYDEALEHYRSAIELNPKNSSPLNDWAWLLVACPDGTRRDPAQALELAKKTIALEPNVGGYWNTLGVVHYRLGQWAEARQALMKAIELKNPDHGVDLYFLSMVDWQEGARAAAQQRLNEASAWAEKHDPKNKELQRFRAEAEALIKK